MAELDLRQFTRGRAPRWITIDEALSEPDNNQSYARLASNYNERHKMTVEISDYLTSKGVRHIRNLSTYQILIHGGKRFLICNTKRPELMQGLSLDAFLQ